MKMKYKISEFDSQPRSLTEDALAEVLPSCSYSFREEILKVLEWLIEMKGEKYIFSLDDIEEVKEAILKEEILKEHPED